MKLTVTFDQLSHNWYAGTFYSTYFQRLKENSDIEVEYVHTHELAKRYNLRTDYNNSLPSVFSPYNLFIINEENNKTFIHSWHDYAPAIMTQGSGIENFDVVKFVCTSRLTQGEYDNKSQNYKIQPGFYMLENWDDSDFIEKNKSNLKEYNKAYFNGLNYGLRQRFVKTLSESAYFNIKIKDNGGFVPKPTYYEELSKHRFGFNLDGVGMICYRDLECLGLNVLLLREKLDVLMYEPLIAGKHYVEIIDSDIKNRIHNDDEKNYILEKIESKIQDLLDTDQVNYILHEGRQWYNRNCLKPKQFEIMDSFLENFEIFK
jgi:hypothetical protein